MDLSHLKKNKVENWHRTIEGRNAIINYDTGRKMCGDGAQGLFRLSWVRGKTRPLKGSVIIYLEII